ncbi:hypothetical protein WJX81_000311 [Elliptochloris bilobata]|uniref:Anamorsin homolog n=1 Tax=Elliptochloris bilobata TaxID=381761 RepID=A0AAW1QMS0_9CHLO
MSHDRHLLLSSAPVVEGSLEPRGAASLEALRKELLLAGFVDAAVSTPVRDAPEGSAVSVAARKPRWETGAFAAIALKPRAAAAPAPSPAVPTLAAPAPAPATSVAVAKAWMLIVDGDGGEELLDDEELLTEEDRARPAVPAAEDCSVGASKKACANCSCGRAEAEAAGEKAALTAEMLANPQSACGSCGLGDAFRCAGCPYRGLPSFAPGQKIELPADFLTADA